MRKTFISMLLALAALPASAQQNTTTVRHQGIFEFPEFRVAKILQPFGRFVNDTVNLYLGDGSLCFKRDGKVYRADLTNITGMQVDSLVYRRVNEKVMGRVVRTKGNHSLIRVMTVDMKQYKEDSGGNFKMEELGGHYTEQEIDGRRDGDYGLPIKYTYYFFINGEMVPALQTKIKRYIREDMKLPFRRLMNDHFWSWKDEDDLATLLMYF